MDDRTLDKDETARRVALRGREIYERDILREVEPENEGDFLVVDVGTGCYAVGSDQYEFFDQEVEQPERAVLPPARRSFSRPPHRPSGRPALSQDCLDNQQRSLRRPGWRRLPGFP